MRRPAVFGHRAFRLLFGAQLVSLVGDRIAPIALAFAVLDISDHPSDLGLVLACQALPFLLFVLVGGVYADRLRRQRVMLASDLVRAATQTATAVLILTGVAEIWHLAALAAVYGTADAFFQPAAQGLLPHTVPPALVQEANAVIGSTFSTGLIAGPVIAGIVVAAFGPGTAIALDAATFVISAGFLLGLRPRAHEPTAEHGAGFRAQLAGGWREVRSRRWLWTFLLALAAYHVVVLPAVFVGGPIVSERRLDGATSWAIITLCFGVGSVVGDLVALRLKPQRLMRASTGALLVGSCQAAIIGSGASTAVIAGLEGVTGVAVSLSFTLWATALADQVPPGALSRVSSFDFLLSTGMLPIGLALIGPVIAAAGLTATLVGQSVLGVALAALALAQPSTRALRRAGGGVP